MSYKDKAAALEKGDGTYRGGALTVHERPPAMRYPCFANGCPMPGTILPDITTGSTDRTGTCPWHYRVHPSDIPRVTQRLVDWQCVASEIDAGRRVLTGPAAADGRVHDAALEAAWQRLAAAVQGTGWYNTLAPAQGERLGEWVRRLEAFIGARVVEVLSLNQRRMG